MPGMGTEKPGENHNFHQTNNNKWNEFIYFLFPLLINANQTPMYHHLWYDLY